MNNFVNLILIVNVNFSRLATDLWLHLAHARKNVKREFQDNAFQYQYKLHLYISNSKIMQSEFLK